MSQQALKRAGEWLDAHEPVAIATVVRIFGSSSQPLGARMVMTTGNRFAGAVSGGCVETDVYETGLKVLRSGQPLMLHYKHVEDPLIEIGLNCEGKIDVVVEPLTRDAFQLLTEPDTPPYTHVTLCYPNRPTEPDVRHARVYPQRVNGAHLPAPVMKDAAAALHRDNAFSATYADGAVALFEPVLEPLTLLIFGADQTAVPLVRIAKLLGFRTIVTDGRPAFVTRDKHPDADEIIAAWPAEVVQQVGVNDRFFIVSLNHEPRFEDAMIAAIHDKPVRYIGAIGKRVRAEERRERLAQKGFDLNQLPPIHTPIGLDIGGKSPEEIALSIMAEIIAVKNGRTGGRLSLEEQAQAEKL